MGRINYREYFNRSKFMATRDYSFNRALEILNKRTGGKPVDILEIGGMRSTPPHHHERFSDGWSTMWWCEYVKRYGGRVVSVDIEKSHIGVAKKITYQYQNVEFICTDGIKVLEKNNNFNLVYLDGSDDPQQMLDQFKSCRDDSIVLCDDFQLKGKLLDKDGNYTKERLTHKVSRHQMALYYKGCAEREIIIPEQHLIDQKYQEYYYVDTYKKYSGLLKEHKGWQNGVDK